MTHEIFFARFNWIIKITKWEVSYWGPDWVRMEAKIKKVISMLKMALSTYIHINWAPAMWNYTTTKKTERLKILESLHLQGDLGQNIGILLDICFSFRNAFFSWFHNWQHKTNLRLTTWQRRSRPFWMWWHIVLGSYFPTDKSGGMDFENFKFLFFCVNFSITLSTSTRKLRNQ